VLAVLRKGKGAELLRFARAPGAAVAASIFGGSHGTAAAGSARGEPKNTALETGAGGVAFAQDTLVMFQVVADSKGMVEDDKNGDGVERAIAHLKNSVPGDKLLAAMMLGQSMMAVNPKAAQAAFELAVAQPAMDHLPQTDTYALRHRAPCGDRASDVTMAG
jgi:hypothetical protein